MEKIVGAKPLFRDKKRRVWELDFMRGVAVLAMCFDHLMYDLAYFRYWFSNSHEIENSVMNTLSEFARGYWGSWSSYGFRFWAHEIFVFLFLFMVGTSCAFSRDNIKRGAMLAVVAVGFTGLSFILKLMGLMDDGVVFGILHCIALCILCAAALDIMTAWNKKLNLYAPLALGGAILVAGVLMEYWHMARPYDRVFTDAHFVGYIMGTHAFGDDWFGLFPALGAVLMGMYWGKAVYLDRASLLPRLDGKWNSPFTFVGRHALPLYIIHQAVIGGLLVLVCLCMGYKLAL